MRLLRFMHLLETLLGSLRGCLDRFPDKRPGVEHDLSNGRHRHTAFSVFFMQSPSFLAHQRQFGAGHGRSDCTSLVRVGKIPSDTHIRDMLDSASTTLLRPAFANTLDQLRRLDGGLAVFRRLAAMC